MEPLVTVATPAYNGERFIAEAIESVLGQSWPRVELIVVDDGSTDGTAGVVEGFAGEGVRLMRQANAGPAAARNAGIRAGSGEFVCYLDQDDRMTPRRIELQVGYLLEHPDAGIVLGREELEVEPGTELPYWASVERLPKPGAGPGAGPNRDTIHPPNTLLARRAAFEQLGGFSEDVLYSDDVDFVLTANDLGIGVGMIDDVVLTHRLHGANITNDHDTLLRGLAHVLKRRIERRRGTGAPSAGPGGSPEPPAE